MPDWANPAFQAEFGTAASMFGLFAFVSALPVCAYKRRWPEIGAVVMMLLSTAGVASGLKIIFFTVSLAGEQLGSLADDKPALLIGGLATLVLSMRESSVNWRKVAGL